MVTSPRKLRPVAAAEEAAAKASDMAQSVKDNVSGAMETASQEASQMATAANRKLKSVGIDTDVMINAAAERGSELQTMLQDQLRDRPMRTLGIAAALGVLVGLITAR